MAPGQPQNAKRKLILQVYGAGIFKLDRVRNVMTVVILALGCSSAYGANPYETSLLLRNSETASSGSGLRARAETAFLPLFSVALWMESANRWKSGEPQIQTCSRTARALPNFPQSNFLTSTRAPTLPVSTSRCKLLRLCASSSARESEHPERVTEQDREFMRLSLDLAEKGKGKTFPNPCVGCVLVKDGEIVGQGYHPLAGMPHAEVLHVLKCKPCPKRPVYVWLTVFCSHPSGVRLGHGTRKSTRGDGVCDARAL